MDCMTYSCAGTLFGDEYQEKLKGTTKALQKASEDFVLSIQLETFKAADDTRTYLV